MNFIFPICVQCNGCDLKAILLAGQVLRVLALEIAY
jgi:hypothetical protein